MVFGWPAGHHPARLQERQSRRPKEIYRRHARGNSLFRSERTAFEDVTIASGVEMGRWAWCSDFVDFDNDGNLDIYIVNGFVTGTEKDDPDL